MCWIRSPSNRSRHPASAQSKKNFCGCYRFSLQFPHVVTRRKEGVCALTFRIHDKKLCWDKKSSLAQNRHRFAGACGAVSISTKENQS